MRMGLKYCQGGGRGHREDNKPLVRASAGFPSCSAVSVWSQLRLQYSASSDRAADMVHWCATQPTLGACQYMGQRGSLPFTSNQMIKNLVVSMGWYLNTRWWHHVAVISQRWSLRYGPWIENTLIPIPDWGVIRQFWHIRTRSGQDTPDQSQSDCLLHLQISLCDNTRHAW